MSARQQLSIFALSFFLWCGTAFGAGSPAYPVKVSTTNPRVLVDQKNVPFLMIGDSPQALMVNLSTNEAATYFADRQAHGFNTAWINLLCTTYTGGRLDASTIDGILPFTAGIPLTSVYDLATPNEAYFSHVDDILHLAAQYNLQVLLDPIETGGFLPTLLANGETRCRAYGQYLGNRYKNFDNIIWMSGNDFQTWSNPGDDAVVLAVARGIQETDTRHLQTVELDYLNLASSSLDDTNWTGIIQLNATYTFLPTYAQLLKDYNRPNFLPNFMVEANYEFEDNVGNLGSRTPQVPRRQEYWTMLSGAAGQLYGNHYTWQFISGWTNFLDTAGATQIGYMKSLFESRAWYNLVPDQDHSVLTAGHGTFTTTGSVNDSDYATAARTPDGTLAMVYMPTVRPLTVDMSKLSATATARWYDPANGTYIQIDGSPFLNGGARIFTPPVTNSGGSGDWVLVLETGFVTPVPPGTYNGLFRESDQVRQYSAGLLTASVTAKRKYSGHLRVGGSRYSFGGRLSLEGHITNWIPRNGASPLALDLQFAVTNAAPKIFGQITNDTWVATLLGDCAVFNARTNPVPFTNRFTLVIPGQTGDSSQPAGGGFGALRVKANGTVTFAGKLADGTTLSQGVPVSKNGLWPLYISLYSGSGSIWSWIAFTNQVTNDLNGSLSWIKPAGASARHYPNGFTNESATVIGSIYTPPAGSNILNLSSASLQFSGGNLLPGFTNSVAIGPRSLVHNVSPDNHLSMRFSVSKGTFTGSVKDAAGHSSPFSGAVLEKLKAGYGFLLGTDQSSAVELAP